MYSNYLNLNRFKYIFNVSYVLQNGTILMNLGAMYHLIGDLNKAEEYYTKSLVYQPNNKVLLDNIQRLRNQKKKR